MVNVLQTKVDRHCDKFVMTEQRLQL